MSKRRKTALFSFSSPDMGEARRWLEVMAEKGWELVKIKQGYFSRAVFAPLERDDLRYDLDIADYFLKDFDKQAEYDRLLSDAGWDLVGRVQDLKVYKSHPGRSPAPIQTDPELARKRYWRQSLLPSLAGCLFTLGILVLLWLGVRLDGPFHLYYLFQSNAHLLAWVLIIIGLTPLIVEPVLKLIREARRMRSGPADPSPAVLRRARLRGVVLGLTMLTPLLANLLIGVSTIHSIYVPPPSTEDILSWPLVFGEHFGRDGLVPSGRVSQDSALLRGIQVRQSFPLDGISVWPDTPTLLEERFDCTFGWVADLVVGGLLNDEYGYTPVELGFDESYMDGENRLLLRQGNTVVRLDAPFDLTSDTALEVLRDRLEGEG